MKYQRLTPLPEGYSANDAALVVPLLVRTLYAVPARWVRCWWCHGARFRWWQSALRCVKCRDGYLLTPGAETWPLPLELVRCPRCARSTLHLSARAGGCVTGGHEWALAAGPLTMHAVIDLPRASIEEKAGRLDSEGRPTFLAESGPGAARHLLKADLKKLRMGRDPLVDYRRVRGIDLKTKRERWANG